MLLAVVVIRLDFVAHAQPSQTQLRDALLLHASFDQSLDADVAAGDKRLHTAVSRAEAKVGLHRTDVKVEAAAGRHGGAVRFGERGANIFYAAQANAGFAPRNWSGTVSVWLRLDPDVDLTGYADPVQMGDKGPLEQGIFIEFTRDAPRSFRLAACPAKQTWNAANRKWEDIAVAERPIVQVDQPPFSRERWTHVVFTWENFNTGQANGVAKLYLDGRPAGSVSNWQQTYNWDPANARIVIGAGYVGLLDDLAIFNRALSADEVKALYGMPGGAGALSR